MNRLGCRFQVLESVEYVFKRVSECRVESEMYVTYESFLIQRAIFRLTKMHVCHTAYSSAEK